MHLQRIIFKNASAKVTSNYASAQVLSNYASAKVTTNYASAKVSSNYASAKVMSNYASAKVTFHHARVTCNYVFTVSAVSVSLLLAVVCGRAFGGVRNDGNLLVVCSQGLHYGLGANL